MKKSFIGVIAIVLGVALSAFTTETKKSTNMYYWFEQTGHTFVGSSASIDGNPLGCDETGGNCVKGYLRSSQPPSEPTTLPNAQFAINE